MLILSRKPLSKVAVGSKEKLLPKSGEAAAQTAQGGGAVTVTGGVPELWKCGTEDVVSGQY